MGKSIVITSGKGGVGKTTLASALGLALAEMNYRVVLIDADFTLNNLDIVLGVECSVVYDITDVVKGKCRLWEALIKYPYSENLFLLPSAHTLTDELDLKGFVNIANELKRNSDYLLIDCPAGIDLGFHRALSVSEEALVVVTPTITALRDADKVIGLLDSYGLRGVGIVVNRARGDLILEGECPSPREISKLLRTVLMGCIPEDDNALLMYSNRDTDYMQAVYMLALTLTGKRKQVFDVTKKYKGVLGAIRRSLKNL